jgi:hypothetical protein
MLLGSCFAFVDFLLQSVYCHLAWPLHLLESFRYFLTVVFARIGEFGARDSSSHEQQVTEPGVIGFDSIFVLSWLSSICFL